MLLLGCCLLCRTSLPTTINISGASCAGDPPDLPTVRPKLSVFVSLPFTTNQQITNQRKLILDVFHLPPSNSPCQLQISASVPTVGRATLSFRRSPRVQGPLSGLVKGEVEISAPFDRKSPFRFDFVCLPPAHVSGDSCKYPPTQRELSCITVLLLYFACALCVCRALCRCVCALSLTPSTMLNLPEWRSVGTACAKNISTFSRGLILPQIRVHLA